MSYLNEVNLIGHIGKDPEILKENDTGSFVRLSVATNKKYLNAQGELLQDTQWHRVLLNGRVGKFAASHLKKGDQVFISGELRTQTWEDKNKQKKLSTEIYAKECQILGGKRGEEALSVEDTAEIDNTGADLDQ